MLAGSGKGMPQLGLNRAGTFWQLDDLRRHRPELANAFERAIGTGVIAMD